MLSNLSSLHALFEVDDDGRFRAVSCAPRQVLDEDLVTIQRYAGKTNEAFTHLLVNLALAASGDAFARLLAGERLRLLDPPAGGAPRSTGPRSTGWTPAASSSTSATWRPTTSSSRPGCKDKRLKHTVERATLRKGRAGAGPPRHDHLRRRQGRGARTGWSTSCTTTRAAARDHFTARSMDVLVCDLPYGVQHGSRPAPARSTAAPSGCWRRPCPCGSTCSSPGAAAALAWNRRTLAAAPAGRAGRGRRASTVLAAERRLFVHRVDRSITRDVLVAVRPVTRADMGGLTAIDSSAVPGSHW